MISTQPSQLADFIRAASEQRTNPGVIVLTHQGQLLYMNHEAAALCDEINHFRLGHVARGVLPTEVVNLCHDLAERILAVTDVKDCEGLHLRRVIDDLTHPMLIRGFGIPGLGDVDHVRILVMLDRIASRMPASIAQVNRRLHLTDRGQAVVQCLAQGHTNKEIAERLGITEQTVKEHIQRLMRKTKTATRTGMLARIFLESHSESITDSDHA